MLLLSLSGTVCCCTLTRDPDALSQVMGGTRRVPEGRLREVMFTEMRRSSFCHVKVLRGGTSSCCCLADDDDDDIVSKEDWRE